MPTGSSIGSQFEELSDLYDTLGKLASGAEAALREHFDVPSVFDPGEKDIHEHSITHL